MTHRRSLFGGIGCFLALFLFPGEPVAGGPNVIVILADDLGYGDLGCYGSSLNRTPHLDQLASEGIRFTDFHSNGPMCTPTRAALLTGHYQQRLGRAFESALSGKAHYGTGLPHETETIAERLGEAGYATGCFGKWHLGYQPPFLPLDHGFETFRGLGSGDGDHHTHVDRSGRPDWWFDNERRPETGYTADLLVQHALSFIEAHRERPFFVYLAHLAIHFPWQGPGDPPHRRPGRDYWNDKWGIIPDRNNVAPHVKAMIEAMDRGVGQLVAALRQWGLERKTVVFFLSDNGGYTHYASSHQNISSNGRLRGQKTELFEGGHRVPAIAWWPGRITPAVSDATAMSFDLAPTIAGLASLATKERIPYDGVDLSSVLLGQGVLAPRSLFWRMDDEGAVRAGDWKWIKIGEKAPLLFNLAEDLSEANDLHGKLPQRSEQLRQQFLAWERQWAPPF